MTACPPAQAMAMANAGINPVELQRTMQQFAAQSERMEMTEDMVGDMIDDFDGEEEGEVDEYTSRVLAEVGLEISSKVRDGRTLQAVPVAVADTCVRACLLPPARWEKPRHTASPRQKGCPRQRRLGWRGQGRREGLHRPSCAKALNATALAVGV